MWNVECGIWKQINTSKYRALENKLLAGRMKIILNRSLKNITG